MKSPRNALPLASLSILATLLALARNAPSQSLAHWHEARGNAARTGTVVLPFATREPRLAWRVSRTTPSIATDSTGPTIVEVDLNGAGAADIVAITDRSIAAWDGSTGRRLWPSGIGEYFPLLSIAGVADLDGDHRDEIIAIGRDNTVAVYDASGARRWSLASNRVTSGFAGVVRVVDFSGTGDPPQLLVVRTDASDVLRASLYRFDASLTGTEVRFATIPSDGQLSSARAAIGDFNGDAIPDILFLRSPGAAGTFTGSIIEGNGTAAGPTWRVVERSITAPMGGCIPPSSASLRVQVFAANGRDVVAFKQTSGATDTPACIGVVSSDAIGPSMLWSTSIPSPDTTAVPFVGSIVSGGSDEMIAAYPQTVTVGMSTEVQNTVRVIDAATGATITSFGSNAAFTTGYQYLGLARLNGATGPLSVLTTNNASARFVHAHDGTTFQRSPALNSLTIDRAPRLLVGAERYGISTAGRAEPIVVETATGSAILGRSSSGNPRLFTVTRDETIMGATPLPGAFVAPRIANTGALLTVTTGAAAQWGLRRVDATLSAVGPDVRDEGSNPPLFLRAPPSFTSTTALRAELRAMPTPLTRGATVLAPARAGWLDLSDANPYEIVPAFVGSALGCNESMSGANNALTTSGEFFFTSTTTPITGGNRHYFDRAMNRCLLSRFAVSDIFGAAITGLSLTNDYLRLPLAGSPASGVLTFASRDNGTNRELYAGIWSVNPPQFDFASYRIASNVTASVPAIGSVLGRSFGLVISAVGSSSTPPHVANFFLGESPMRVVRVNMPDNAALRFAPQAPIIVDGANGAALIINNNPAHGSTSYTRPSIVRAAAVADSVELSFAAWGPTTSPMDAQGAALVRCGANYRLIYHVRVGALASEDARFEAWEFSPTITAPATANYTMDQGMTRAWSVCLDRAGGSIDCASPPPAERLGRVSWTNLVATQSGATSVLAASNSAGQVFALENICSDSPRLRWTYTEDRALSSLSAFDADDDGQAELVALSSDGTYHGIDEAECNVDGDTRCPTTRPFCDVAKKTCVECLEDSQCTATGRSRCDLERRTCVPCSMMGASCAGSGGVCTAITRSGNSAYSCTCATAMDCNAGFACVTDADAGTRGVCTVGCDPAAPRCPIGQYCAAPATGSLGRCVGACSSDEECARTSPSRPVCATAMDAGVRSCVECNTSAQCAARNPALPACVAQRCAECEPGGALNGSLNSCAGNARGARCLANASCGCDSDSECNGGRCDRTAQRCITTGDAGASMDGGTSPWNDTSCACRAHAPTHSASSRDALIAMVSLAFATAFARRRRARWTRSSLLCAATAATLFFGVACLQSTSAHAQSAPARRAVQCGEDGSAELFAEAREQFDAGQTALLANDATGAERSLRAAIALYDSPNTHLLLGRALSAQQRFEDAYDEFETTVLLATRCSIRDTTERGRARYTRSIEQGATERAQIAPRVALLSVHFESGAPSGATITIGSRPALALVNDRTFAAPEGQSAVSVTAPGYRDWRGTVTLSRGRVAAIEVNLERIVEGPRVIERRIEPALVRVRRVSPLFGVGLVTAGVGVATAATGAVLFVLGRERFAALDRACTSATCPQDPAFLAAVDRGQRLEFAGQITMYTGIGVTVVGAVITLATLPRTEWVPAPNATRTARNAGPTLWVAPSLGAMVVGGAL